MTCSMEFTRRNDRAGSAGFSLVEVLVALVIISVGMLGLAKIQALAYSSTGVANLQSAAAIQASSLAAAMRANRNYWSAAATTTSSLSFVATTSSLTATTATPAALNSHYVCTSGGANAPCTNAQMAAYDLEQWVLNLNLVLPHPTTTINCPALAVSSAPVGCSIQIDWTEQTTAINSQSAGNALAAPRYTLYVVP